MQISVFKDLLKSKEVPFIVLAVCKAVAVEAFPVNAPTNVVDVTEVRPAKVNDVAAAMLCCSFDLICNSSFGAQQKPLIGTVVGWLPAGGAGDGEQDW